MNKDAALDKLYKEYVRNINMNNVKTGSALDTASIDEILKERGSRYGCFNEHARITQGIKSILQSAKGYQDISSDKKEALEMIAHKLGRIVNGDPNYRDSWTDIIGYAKLVEDKLK